MGKVYIFNTKKQCFNACHRANIIVKWITIIIKLKMMKIEEDVRLRLQKYCKSNNRGTYLFHGNGNRNSESTNSCMGTTFLVVFICFDSYEACLFLDCAGNFHQMGKSVPPL